MSRPQSEAEYLARLVPPSVAATSFNRRALLRAGAGLGAAAGGAVLLSACGGSDSSSSGSTVDTVRPCDSTLVIAARMKLTQFAWV